MEFRLRDFAYPLAIARMHRLLQRSQWWDAARMEAFQSERLRTVVSQAVAHVPAWRELFPRAALRAVDVARPSDLPKLPILTKDDVREHAPELVADDARAQGERPMSTSGSTGTALSFLLDKNTNVLEFATLWRHWGWHGYRFGHRFA